MNEWKVTTLKEVAAEDQNGLATGPFGSAVSSINFRTSGVPMLRGNNLSLDVGIRLNESGLVFVESKLAAQFQRSLARRGDLVFTSWGTIGQVGLIENSSAYSEYLVSNKQMKLTPNPKIADSLFLYYYLSQLQLIRDMQDHAIGSSVPGFNLGQLRSVRVTLPSLRKQKAIAEVLGALDDKIAANSELVNTSTELAQSLTALALSAGDTVALTSVANVTMGSSPKGTTYNEVGDGIVLYQGIRDFGVRFPTPRIWTTEPIRRADEGDLLLSVRAPVGALNVTNSECCIGRGLAAIRSATPSALYHVLLAQPALFDSFNSDGTIFGSINKNHLLGLRVKVPTGGLATLDKSLAPIELCVTAALRESETLAQLRDTLLPALMDGRIHVPDAIEQAEEVL